MEKGGIFLVRVTYTDLGSLYFTSIRDFQLDEVYDYIKTNDKIEEAVVLWTCNRFEIYFYPGNRESVEFLETYINGKSLKHSVAHGLDAIKHLFLVSAGLDSMVVGESEILAQIKEAWDASKQRGLSRKTMNEMLRKALEVGRKARRKNGNGKHVRSVAGEALGEVEMLPSQRVLVIGAGELGTQVSGFLYRNEIPFHISNRSQEKAKEISKAYGAEIENYDRKKWRDYDIVITTTKSPEFILDREDLLDSRIKTVVDLGVPPNVSEDVPEGVRLVNMELLSRNIQARSVENTDYAIKSLETVNEEFEKYSRKLMDIDKEELLKKIFDYSNEVIREEMKYFENRTYDPETEERVRKGLESTRNRLLGFVINGIKKANDVRSSETITNMEMILDENFSRYENEKDKKVH